MCGPAAVIAPIAGAALGVGASLYQGSKARKAQKKAQAANERQAQQQAQRAEEQFNRANQKQPGVEALLAGNRQNNRGGLSSTFLTGPSGVGTMPLGGVSLLGQ